MALLCPQDMYLAQMQCYMADSPGFFFYGRMPAKYAHFQPYVPPIGSFAREGLVQHIQSYVGEVPSRTFLPQIQDKALKSQLVWETASGLKKILPMEFQARLKRYSRRGKRATDLGVVNVKFEHASLLSVQTQELAWSREQGPSRLPLSLHLDYSWRNGRVGFADYLEPDTELVSFGVKDHDERPYELEPLNGKDFLPPCHSAFLNVY